MLRREMLLKTGLVSAGLGLSLSVKATPLKPQRVLRIAHLTDVHMQHLLGAAKGFEKCLHHIQNHPVKPDFIFNGGDCIMGTKQSPLKRMERQFSMFNDVISSENSLPVYHCVGNHDIWYGNEKDMPGEKKRAMENMGLPRSYYHFRQQGWNFIVLDSIQPSSGSQSYMAGLDAEQFHWLKKTLGSIPEEEPVLVMSHVPILAACVFFDGNNFDDDSWRIPGSWMHTDAGAIVKLFHKHKNVKLALSGHIHLLDKVTYNGVTYCCNGAVSGAWWTGDYKETPLGYALIDLYDNGHFEVSYQQYLF